MLSKRGYLILNDLLDDPSGVRIEELSQKYEVSARTIRNDLNAIDVYLNDKKFRPILRQSKTGLKIYDDDRFVIRTFLNKSEKMYFLNSDDRIAYIAKTLMMHKDYIVMQTFIDQLQVSKSTIVSDLEKLKKKCMQEGLEVETRTRFGFKIVGIEFAKRQYLLNRVLEPSVDADCKIDNYWHFFNKRGHLIEDLLVHTQGYTFVKEIYDLVDYIELKQEYNFSDRSYYNLVWYILLTVNRIKEGFHAYVKKPVQEDLFHLSEYKLAQEISMKIIDLFNCTWTVDETCCLSIQMSGGKVTQSIFQTSDNYADLQMLVFGLIEDVSRISGIHFDSSIKLFNTLLYHLKPAIFRIQHGMQFSNPLLEEIIDRYYEIFKVLKACISSIENYCGASVSDDEIGYLTLHFASVMESNSEIYVRPNVLIVCNHGIGTTAFLSGKLLELYDIFIVGAVSVNELNEQLETQNIDVVISTIKLSGEFALKTVEVNALLTKEDIACLDRLFLRKPKVDVEALIDIVKRHSTIHRVGLLKDDIKRYLDPNCEREVAISLRDIITPELVFLDYQALDWEDAVRKAGALLLKGGYIESEYIENMVKTVRERGPYIVIGKGIALPHARSGAFVQKVGISILRLKEPVVFGNPKNDPVQLVLSICTTDNKAHLNALRELSKILNDEQWVTYMKEEKNLKRMIQFLRLER